MEYSNIYIDENNEEYLIDKNGEALIDERGNKIPPTQTSKKINNNGFITYDTSQGHCPLCGNLYCRGTCFK